MVGLDACRSTAVPQSAAMNYALISAGGTIVTLPIILVYIIMQRQFLRGLTAGALRG